MTETVAIKTHLIITDIHDEYDINWCGKLLGADPVLIDNIPVFIVRSNGHRAEVNTWDMKELEHLGKQITSPKGRGAISSAQAYIYLKEKDNKERLMCVITHKRIKSFAPMYDKIEVK